MIDTFKASGMVLIPIRETDAQKWQRNQIKALNVFIAVKTNVTIISKPVH